MAKFFKLELDERKDDLVRVSAFDARLQRIPNYAHPPFR